MVKNDLVEVMRVTTGKRGEELDRKKYKMLISEYTRQSRQNTHSAWSIWIREGSLRLPRQFPTIEM